MLFTLLKKSDYTIHSTPYWLTHVSDRLCHEFTRKLLDDIRKSYCDSIFHESSRQDASKITEIPDYTGGRGLGQFLEEGETSKRLRGWK
jgi:hypothetical protein